jgi:hypothetical protein
MEAMSELLPQPGVLAWIFAEGEDGGAGIDLGGDDGAGAEEGDAGGEAGDGAEGADGAAAGGEAGGEAEKIDGRRGSKEYRDALKAWGATPEGAKFAKQAQTDHFRAHEIATLEPNGLTAMREKYALLESVGGPAAITQMQERIAETDAVDAALAAGDPKALESLGPDFDPGLAKLAPQILDRVMRSNPEAYAAAILPHLMSGLMNSPMVGDLNRMIDALQAPHLDDKGKLAAVTQLLGRIGQWFDANEKKAGQLKAAPTVDKERGQFEQERTKFEQEQQQAHWNNGIAPQVASFEKSKLEELYKPYEGKLKLDAAAKADLFETFKARMTAAGRADAAYMKQMEIYRKQKNPDPAIVANFVKAAINRHAKNVVEGAIKARYGRFLGAAKKTTGAATTTVQGARSSTTTAGQAAVVVSAKPKPEEIDYQRTSEKDQWDGLYTLKTGKKVQYRKPQ